MASILKWIESHQGTAAWVQAFGSIAAILWAVWIASAQHRRDIIRRKRAEDRLAYLVAAELAWLSTDIVGFLNQFINVESGSKYAFVISDDEVADFLRRLSWSRQRVAHKGQLGMVGTLRASLMDTVGVVRMREAHPPMIFLEDEIRGFADCRDKAVEVMNAANGVQQTKQYSP